jgi:hypothetical protein
VAFDVPFSRADESSNKNMLKIPKQVARAMVISSGFVTAFSCVGFALQLATPCTCPWDWGSMETIGAIPAPCEPLNQTIQIVVDFDWSDGRCPRTACTEKTCDADVAIVVNTDSPCRYKIWRNTSVIGGGTGGEFFAVSRDHLECGDFVDYVIHIGSVDVYRFTNICVNCSSPGG